MKTSSPLIEPRYMFVIMAGTVVVGGNFVRKVVPGRFFAATKSKRHQEKTVVEWRATPTQAIAFIASPIGRRQKGRAYDGRLTARRYGRYRTTLTPRVGANGDTTWRAVKKLESSDIFSYAGPFETHNGRTTVQTGFGHWDYADSAHVWYARDIKGSVRNTVQLSASGARQSTNHVFTYPSGLPVRVGGAWRTARLHQGKEWIEADGTGWYDNAARIYDAILIRFLTPDPLWHDFGTTSPYNYCLANPMTGWDPDGKAWTPYYGQESSVPAGYCWIPDEMVTGADGQLSEGYYHQAILFAPNPDKPFNPESRWNLGSSIATVYKADGSIETFDACTYPSDVEKFPTIPEREYEAKMGFHKQRSDYPALRVADKGCTNFATQNTIELGFRNPSSKTFTTKAVGINIHRAGDGKVTGKDSKGVYVSEGCLLIDKTKWKSFISIFNNSDQINNIVSVTVSR